MIRVLVLNSGSSSIKYRLFDMAVERLLASGAVERIGEDGGIQRHRLHGKDGMEERHEGRTIPDHRAGLDCIGGALRDSGVLPSLAALAAVGHRVVHGGERFRQPVRVNRTVLDQIRDMIPLAPLHNPANLLGMEVTLAEAPEVPQVAVFDTAFHHTLPPHAYRYALPERFYREHGVRRYGFHGTSHACVARGAAAFLGRPLAELRLVTLHLGNGASAAAIAGGRSVDTSMGMTPLEGLMMGTRCGDLDPAVPFYLGRAAGLDNGAVEALLNRDSGLKGICGSNDMREVKHLAAAGDDRARLALDMYAYRIRKYLGAYHAVLGGLDAVVFTAGVGENDPTTRAACCAGLTHLGLILDPVRNEADGHGPRAIHAEDSAVALLVIPTDEELEIARQTVACLGLGGGQAAS